MDYKCRSRSRNVQKRNDNLRGGVACDVHKTYGAYRVDRLISLSDFWLRTNGGALSGSIVDSSRDKLRYIRLLDYY